MGMMIIYFLKEGTWHYSQIMYEISQRKWFIIVCSTIHFRCKSSVFTLENFLWIVKLISNFIFIFNDEPHQLLFFECVRTKVEHAISLISVPLVSGFVELVKLGWTPFSRGHLSVSCVIYPNESDNPFFYTRTHTFI